MGTLLILKNRIPIIVDHLKRQPAMKFLLLMTFYNLIVDVVVLPFFLISGFLGFEHSHPDVNPVELFVAAITLSPILETLIGQMLPILIARRFIKSHIIIIAISAFVFALPHCTEDVTRFLPSFLGGILLAFTFLHWLDRSKTKAYWVTCGVHFLHNLIVLGPILFLKRPYV